VMDDVGHVGQEVFIAPSPTWLYRVCKNVSLHGLRRHHRFHAISVDEEFEDRDDRTPQRRIETAEQMRAVHRIASRMSPELRRVFLLSEIDEIQPREIATLTGAPALP
jgi:RNA polymerase sigma factor (sigma-70 family)